MSASYTPPALPSGMKALPDGPTPYCFQALWGGNTVTYFERLSLEMETKQIENVRTASVPGMPGAVDLDGDDWHLWGSMVVSIRFRVNSVSGRQAILSGIVGPGRLWLCDQRGARFWTRARLVRPRNVLDIFDQEHEMYPLALDFMCHLGSWFAPYTDADARYGYAKYGSSTYGGGDQSITLSTTSDTGEIVNVGNLPLLALEATMSASGGTIVTPTIENAETSQTVKFTGTLADGTAWVLDTAIPSLKKVGADDWDNLTIGDQQDILWLLPGSNTINITSAALMHGTLSFEFWHPYRF